MTQLASGPVTDALCLVGPKDRFSKVSLTETIPSGYLLYALEIDRRPPFTFGFESSSKRAARRILKPVSDEIARQGEVLEAILFKALLIPPGKGEFLKERPQIEVARFDLVLLIELESEQAAERFRASQYWRDVESRTSRLASRTLTVTATNARRIGPVDHERDGVFLFNFFYADDVEQNLGIWEYTAGWFQDETGLDNSTLLLPAPDQTDYSVVNHCRWDGLGAILPSLLFKSSFRSFVLENFSANSTAAMPILYRLA